MSSLGVCPLIVIDGANVGCGVSGGRGTGTGPGGQESVAALFRASRVAHAIEYFRTRGHPAFAFIPAYFSKLEGRGLLSREDRGLLSRLVAVDAVVLTPPQDADDRYILWYAFERDGFVVSNDMFRDHAADSPELSAFIAERVISFAFVGAEEFVPNPDAAYHAHELRTDADALLHSLAANAERWHTSLHVMLPAVTEAPEAAPGDGEGDVEMRCDGGGAPPDSTSRAFIERADAEARAMVAALLGPPAPSEALPLSSAELRDVCGASGAAGAGTTGGACEFVATAAFGRTQGRGVSRQERLRSVAAVVERVMPAIRGVLPPGSDVSVAAFWSPHARRVFNTVCAELGL